VARQRCSPEVYVLRDTTRNLLVAERTLRPRDVVNRSLGLLVRPPLQPGEALWLDPCGGIHTWGMGYAIDVLFLDAGQRVVGVARGVRPWRMVWKPAGTRSVVELAAGGAAGVEVGDQMSLAAGNAGAAAE
jgi:uncharacterized membrane protein (UPF0127 family)